MPKRRLRKDLTRPSPKREPYERVLIVCEGERTEPLYFTDLMDRHRLSTANIVVTGEGADPGTVVREAKNLRCREIRDGENYDRVYCVFDRDEHATFNTASQEARASRIKLARSWPCFEFWLVLHFGFTRGPYTKSPGKSAAQHCVDALRALLPGYEKGAGRIFRRLEDRLDEALSNADRAKADAKATGSPNPSTEIHKLVRYLVCLKKDR